ncbi:MAG: efflux RND transporter periplasmic adaptor subunit [Nitrospira sp.]|nr:efflux RND transporter periplasmic adaptor subunit [Nitrospira sp.]MDH5347172.1 efflux RND transporter periplasmic adaptor subunit [Nitrospira sp.]MDH5497952.1 efflux RND transporter periplasmic adaptor subunit [Nitrospira sp.]MDH5725522.1 efflux RND transporter periplasmic adaptor subunit [Nitrospira sp.]
MMYRYNVCVLGRILVSASTMILLLLPACGQSDQPPKLVAAPHPPTTQETTAPVEAGPHVETIRVEFSSSHQGLTLSGKIAYGEDKYSRISSPLQGRVVEVRAHLGGQVKAGDVLLIVDSPDIAQAYSEYVKEDSDLQYATRAQELAKDLYETRALALKDLKQAENELVKARAEFRRAKERLLSFRISSHELNKPLDKQQITSRFEMKSPLSGTVVERTVTPGQSVTGDPDHVLFTVADLDVLQVVADVYEHDLALVREGQSAVVKVEAYPDVEFLATVTAVGDVVDPVTRTIKVRARVNNDAHKLKPEMFARLQLDVSGTGQFLIVPREAFLEADGKRFVYVVEEGNRYVQRPVKTANISPDQTRIIEGLTQGERIVTKGAVLIKGQEAQERNGSSLDSQ